MRVLPFFVTNVAFLNNGDDYFIQGIAGIPKVEYYYLMINVLAY